MVSQAISIWSDEIKYNVIYFVRNNWMLGGTEDLQFQREVHQLYHLQTEF